MFFLDARRERSRLSELMSGYLTGDDAKGSTNRLEQVLSRLPTAIAEKIAYAGLDSEQVRRLIARVVVLSTVAVLVGLAWAQPFIIFLPVVGISVEYWHLSRRALKRAEDFERDYTSLLLSLASGVRTGLDPLSALCHANELFPKKTELARELQDLNRAIERGLSEDDVIARFAVTIQHPDVDLFRTAFLLARKEGASLAEALQRLVRVTRARQSFRRKIRTALAMQKLSAIGIGGCAAAIGLIQFATNPQALTTAIAHPVAVKILTGGVTLILFGLGWMFHLSRSRL